jgi:hypothetical protein
MISREAASECCAKACLASLIVATSVSPILISQAPLSRDHQRVIFAPAVLGAMPLRIRRPST